MTMPKVAAAPARKEDLVRQLPAWDAVLREATTEVFSTMVGTSVAVPPAPQSAPMLPA
jgi:hypothetical protein